MAMADAIADATTSDDDELLLAIQQALKPRRSSAPKLEHLAVAVALARDPQLLVSTTCKAAGFKSSGTRKTIMNYRNRIVEEQLLSLTPIGEQLLVQQQWIHQHAPRVRQLICEPLIVDGQQATRAISAHIDGLEDVVRGEIKYDMSPTNGADAQKQRRDLHRRREERAIIRLDDTALAAHKAHEAERKRDQRETRRELVDLVANLIERVERRADTEASMCEWWCCPAGCESGTRACARVAFRQSCAPTRAEIEQQLQQQWEAEHCTQHGEFRSHYSGCRFGVKEQTRLHKLQAFYWRGKKPIFECRDSELCEIQEAFLTTWDGVITPSRWLEVYLGCGRVVTHCGAEYCGERVTFDPDRFGGDHRPVGPAACARHDCMGCCYCLGVALPVYIEVRIFRPREGHEARWVKADKLMAEMQRLAACGRLYRGCVVCVAGEIRAHAHTDMLVEWRHCLEPIDGCLIIACGDSCDCILSANEMVQIDAHHAKHAEIIARETEAFWKQVEAEQEQLAWFRRAKMQGGCKDCDQRRNGGTTGPPALRKGDIVHRPQPQGHPQDIAVVVEVVTTRSRRLKCLIEHLGPDGSISCVESGADSTSALRTGEVNLAMYSEKSSSFTRIDLHEPEADWMLFPACCGRGWECPGMRWLARYRWPTGDRLDPLEVLAPISEAFAGFLGAREHHWRRRQALEQQFKALLCGHRIRKASNAGKCELSDEQSDGETEACDSEAEREAEDEASYEYDVSYCQSSDSEAAEDLGYDSAEEYETECGV